eukprot:5042548-Amphidinium_carterae.1
MRETQAWIKLAFVTGDHTSVCQALDRMVMRPLKTAIRQQVISSADFAKDIIDAYTSGGTFEIQSRLRLPGW